MDPQEMLRQAIEEQKRAFEEFKKRYDGQLAALVPALDKAAAEQKRGLDAIEKRLNLREIAGVRDDELGACEEVKAFVGWMRTGQLEAKAMSINVGPSGGYTAPKELAALIEVVGAEQGAIRNLARIYPLTSGDFHQPISRTLAGAAHVGETGTRNETTTPDLADFHPTHGGLSALAPATNWILGDSAYDLEGYIRDSIGTAFGVTESADFVSGDGVNKASGFLNYPLAATADATREWGQIEKLHAGSTSDFDIDDLISLVGKLAPRYRKRAAFVMSPDTETYVRKLKSATTGQYYWQPSTAAGVPPTLLGYPSFVDVNMPTIASAAGVVAFADWKRFYAIADIGPMTAIRDQVTVKGQTIFYFEKRVGGGVLDFNAGKVLVMSA